MSRVWVRHNQEKPHVLQSTFCFVKKYVIDIAMITTTPSDSNNVIYHAFPFMYPINKEAVSRQRMIDVMMQKI